MSLSAEKKHIKHEMAAGVHLATILGMKMNLDDNKDPIKRDGEISIIVTFLNGQNQHHEQVYWIGKGEEGKERYFTRLCIDSGVDMSITPISVKQVKGKRVWIAIREVFTLINNGEDVKKDMFEKPIKEHFIFATSPVFDADKAPSWKGDPAKNNGEAADDFVGYREENETSYDTISEAKENKIEGPVLQIESSNPKLDAEMEAAFDTVKSESDQKIKKATEDLVVKSDTKVEAVVEKTAETEVRPNFGDDTPVINSAAPTVNSSEQEAKDKLTKLKELQNKLNQTPSPNF